LYFEAGAQFVDVNQFFECRHCDREVYVHQGREYRKFVKNNNIEGKTAEKEG